MTRINDAEKNATNLKNELGDGITALNPTQLMALHDALVAKAGTYRSAATEAQTMSSTAKTEAATFRSEYTPDAIYQDTVDALTESGDKFHTSLINIADAMENDADGAKWFAEHQQNNDADAAHKLQNETQYV